MSFKKNLTFVHSLILVIKCDCDGQPDSILLAVCDHSVWLTVGFWQHVVVYGD